MSANKRSMGASRRYERDEEHAASRVRYHEQMSDPERRARWLEAVREGKRRQAATSTLRKRQPAEYRAWDAMVQRCTNPRTKQFKDYGGRGIAVSAGWLGRGGFARFFADVGSKPSPEHTLGRVANDGPYAPGNVRWETRLEQMANWGRNRMVTINDETLHLAEWARRIGVASPTLLYRLRQGWSASDLLRPGRQN